MIRLLAINVTPISSSNDIIIARFKLHLERYIRGSGTPTLHDGSDLFGTGSLEDDPLLRAREFLRCVTGSEFLPACPQQKILVRNVCFSAMLVADIMMRPSVEFPNSMEPQLGTKCGMFSCIVSL